MDDLHAQSHQREIGRKDGRRRRRTLSSEDARRMVRVREAKKLFREFHDR